MMSDLAVLLHEVTCGCRDQLPLREQAKYERAAKRLQGDLPRLLEAAGMRHRTNLATNLRTVRIPDGEGGYETDFDFDHAEAWIVPEGSTDE